MPLPRATAVSGALLGEHGAVVGVELHAGALLLREHRKRLFSVFLHEIAERDNLSSPVSSAARIWLAQIIPQPMRAYFIALSPAEYRRFFRRVAVAERLVGWSMCCSAESFFRISFLSGRAS